MRYYLYRHIMNNEPFYIGVGTKPKIYNTNKREYQRAYCKTPRSIEWKEYIKGKSYDVEIMIESDDYKYILQQERFFISLYINKYKLLNKTTGGQAGYRFPKTKEVVEKTSCKLRKEFSRYSMEGYYIDSFIGSKLASNVVGVHNSFIIKATNGLKPSAGGFQWRYFKTEKIDSIKEGNKPIEVSHLNEDGTITKFKSFTQYAKFLNMNVGTLIRRIKNK